MMTRYFFISLFTLFSVIFTDLTAQIASDNAIHANAKAVARGNVNTATLNNFELPAGSKKLLLVGVIIGIDANIVAVNTVTFGTTTLTAASGSPFNYMTGIRNSASYFFFLTQAELNAALTQDITVNLTGTTPGGLHIFAASYSNVDQSDPLSGAKENIIPQTNATQTSSVNIVSANGDMVADLILAADNPTTFTAGTDQSVVAATNNLLGDSKMSEKMASDGMTTMSYNLRGADGGGGHYGININGAAPSVTDIPIPTMSQWGLLIFGLLIMNLSVFFVQRRVLI